MIEEKFYAKLMDNREKVHLRLESKKMPLIAVDQHLNTVKFIRSGQQDETSAARTSRPFDPHIPVAYFEAKILNCRRKNNIAIGLVSQGSALKKHPGQSKFSLGYISTGQVYFNRLKIGNVQPYGKSQVIGIGIDFAQKNMFITLNGIIIKVNIPGYQQIGWKKFYPCISLGNEGQEVEAIFQQSKFMYPYKTSVTQTKSKIFKQISEEKCDLNDIYDMVGDYLWFNGYNKSYEMFKSMKEGLKEVGLCKNPQSEVVLELKKNVEQQNVEDPFENIMNEDLQVEDINMKSVQRQRIMSDYWSYSIPNDLPRKNTLQEERLMIDSRRKNSYISNEQSMIKMNSQIIDVDVNQTKTDVLTENFLKTTRIQIMNNIREQNIQQALTLINNSVPQLFNLNENLSIYFKIHIFLRKIKKQGSQSAIKYAKQNNQDFLKFKESKFPKYSKAEGRFTYVKFQQMMGVIRFQGKQHEALSNHQFQCFSHYINQFIMKSLGYFSESKLGILFNHLRVIQNRTRIHEVNGPLFHVQN